MKHIWIGCKIYLVQQSAVATYLIYFNQGGWDIYSASAVFCVGAFVITASQLVGLLVKR